MIEESGLLARRVSGLLARLVAEEPVIALHGPRSVGKSTVLRILAQEHGVEVIDLDDIGIREAVAGNPIPRRHRPHHRTTHLHAQRPHPHHADRPPMANQ